MTRQRLLLAGFLFGLSISTPVLAEGQPVLGMLQRMQTALQTLNYHGTLVYLQEGQVQSMHVAHRADANGEQERLISLNGVAREVIRKGEVVACYLPDSKTVTVGKRQMTGNVLSKLAENDFSELQRYYQFELESLDRVAGRPTQVLRIKARESDRYGYRLWLDAHNALLLKSELLDERGGVLEQAMFSDIEVVDSIPSAMVEPTTTGEDFSWFQLDQADGSRKLTRSDWRLVALPVGFAVTAHYLQAMPNSRQPAERWVLSDGLASVSVFIEPFEAGQEPFEGGAPMGSVNAFGAVVTEHQITVIGEVPLGTVERIARTIRFSPDKPSVVSSALD
ncbi:MAG: outer membrane lipoprotein-sorting protein [Gammaproteobacteria bacterium]|nr:outer membrane lipoprotein-sorting protein [Gammaproteobacteria bacterium]